MYRKIKKRAIGILSLSLIGSIGFFQNANAQGIDFIRDYEVALAKAKQENKLVFVDFYTSWCGPCKMLDKDVFSQEKVGTHFNTNFINLKVQCDDKGVGVELGEKYKVVAYPTLMFLNKDGEVVHSAVGAPQADGLLKVANVAVDPAKNLLSFTKRWDAGDRDKDFVFTYFKALKDVYQREKSKADFATYFETLNKEEQTSKATFELIQIVGATPFSSMFSFIEDHKQEFSNSMGAEAVDSFISGAYLSYLSNMISYGMKDEYAAALIKFKTKGYPYYEEFAMYCDVYNYKDINEYMDKGTAFLAKYGESNDAYTISLCSLLGNLTGKPNQSIAGLVWMETLLKRNPDPRNLSVYFYLLWRNAQYDKALEVGQQMREDAIANGRSLSSIDEQIEMVKGIQKKNAVKG